MKGSTLLVVLTGVLAASAVNAARVQNVLFLPFQGDGIKPSVLGGLNAILSEQAARVPGVKVADASPRVVSIQEDCGDDPLCMAEAFGRLAITHYVITTVARDPGGGFQLSQTVFKIPDGSVARTSVNTLSGKGKDLEASAFRAAVVLLAPSQLAGGVNVEVNLSGAKIYVDGKPAGTSPMIGAWGGLLEGEHRVKVVKPGYSSVEQPVDVKFNEVTKIDIRLTRDPNQPLESEGGVFANWPIPVGVLAVPPVGLLLAAGSTVALWMVSGGLAAATYYQARTLEQRAAAGQLFLPKDMPRIWLWRVSLAGTLAAAVAGLVTGLTITVATAAVAGTWVALYQVMGGGKTKTWEGERDRSVTTIKRSPGGAEDAPKARKPAKAKKEAPPPDDNVDEFLPEPRRTRPAPAVEAEEPAARAKAKEPPKKAKRAPVKTDEDLPEGE